MSAVRKPKTKITEYEEKDLSIRAIEIRPEILQSRHTTDIGFSRAYAKAMAAGSIFPPVLVFFDGEKYWLADGFTRVHARESLGLPTVRAVVRPGMVEDALLAGIEANFDPYHSRSVVQTDRKHAAELMIRNEKFRKWSDNEICRITGAYSLYVKKLRLQLLESENIPIPDRVSTFKEGRPTGRTAPYRRGNEREGSKVISKTVVKRPNGTMYNLFSTSVDGKKFRLGNNLDAAKSKIEEHRSRRIALRYSLSSHQAFREWLTHKLITSRTINSGVFPVASCLVGVASVGPVGDVTVSSFLECSASLLFSKDVQPGIDRLVMVGYILGVTSKVTELVPHAERIGIEIMTPEEFVAEFGPKADGPDEEPTP